MNDEKRILTRTVIEMSFMGVCYTGMLHTPSDLSRNVVIALICVILATVVVTLEELIIQKLKNDLPDGLKKCVLLIVGWLTYMSFYLLNDFLSGQKSNGLIAVIASLCSICLHIAGIWLVEKNNKKQGFESSESRQYVPYETVNAQEYNCQRNSDKTEKGGI